MAKITPVAYNFSGNPQIPNTTQIGNLSVGTSPQDYGVVGSTHGVVYYSTPNQELGYVIAHQDQSGGHNGKPGNVPAYVGFWRSAVKTEESFLEFVNNMFNQNFTGGTDAVTYLNNNGYWSSYTASSSGNYKLLEQYSPANNNGDITFPGVSTFSDDPNIVGLNPGNGIYINKFDIDGNDNSSILDNLIGRNGTLTLTQGVNSVTYSFTNTAFSFTSGPPYVNQYWWDNFHNGASSPLGTITVTSSASTVFNYVDNITINVT